MAGCKPLGVGDVAYYCHRYKFAGQWVDGKVVGPFQIIAVSTAGTKAFTACGEVMPTRSTQHVQVWREGEESG